MRATLYARLSVPGAAATGHRRSANLDVVRAVAALMVLAAHAVVLSVGSTDARLPRLAGDTAAFLSNGVWLFFALSGYLIAGPFLRALAEGRQQPSPRSYALRRAARILPAYWIALVAVLVLATGSALQHWWQLPAHGLLLQDLFRGEQNRFLFVAWTLSVEAMFYAFVPLAAWLAWRAAGRRALSVATLAKGLLAIWAASVAWRIGLSWIVTPHALLRGTVPWSLEVLRWLLPTFLCSFAPGALIFLAETSGKAERGRGWDAYRRARRHPLVLFALAITLGMAFTAISQRGGRWFDIGTTMVALPAALGVIAMVGDSPRKAALGRLLGPIGLISYGIYLWHAVIRDVIERHGFAHVPAAGAGLHAWPLHALFLAFLTIPVALASWVAVERPLLRLTTNWDRARGGPRPGPRLRRARWRTVVPPDPEPAASFGTPTTP
ncbi:MAG: acyltransferase family protein [Thermoleophilaceae bacterium]